VLAAELDAGFAAFPAEQARAHMGNATVTRVTRCARVIVPAGILAAVRGSGRRPLVAKCDVEAR
jgi:hypothetical protein